ncbi:ornithine cyclodeaminase family protein [Saccharolobus solfataricus]|uniref:Ornithine cyclodeaminase n=2 Tax=Saccharolobus solfataricus TaxID=2287 RepID=A0A0E3K8E5_SACSO|nr:ornithine cyclodeaminase family protein [Saccharolobus solfataricus]AKA73353.1 ornithine cyclodeaminase family protein [Saccharolobus solfataricus]AKA76052.1 ornithine cyclodeaminase family protein [Saccharolobus solfataricus]AKA78745.1 ornithine cyclodeaminase family protein [Saccharolobus solfataricus]AZF67821.1 ornithine cyclodeaminase family protein [Saccharolobus solfataricus]AZF70441.1 ornithine cyclodeaminase family protein [Saccharolobus solfataricus]
MTLLLKENDVINLLDYKQIYGALVNAFLLFENKFAINLERSRISFHGTTLTFQAAGMENYIGYKTFISGNHLTFLYDTSGNLLSIIESDRLSQARTAVLSILATDYVYGDFSSLGVIGLGKYGLAIVEIANQLKKGIKINVFTPSQQRMEKALSILRGEGIDVSPKDSIKRVCEESEVVTTITKAKDPFLKLEYVNNKRIHINAMGSNIPEKIEIFPEVIKASNLIVVEELEQSLKESGELVIAKRMGMLDMSKITLLSWILSRKINVQKEGITIFKSVGIGLEDLAVGKLIYEKALSKGLGTEIEVKGVWYRESEKK